MGPKRFTDLLNNLPGIGTNLLASRLRELKEAGVLERQTLPPPAASSVYDLTGLGRGLESVIVALHQWGNRTQGAPKEGDHFRPGWSVLAMRLAFRPEAAGGLKETYEFCIGHEVFHARIDNGTIETRQAPADDPDLVVTTDSETYKAIALRELTLEGAAASGAIRVEGDAEALRRCAEVFGLPTD